MIILLAAFSTFSNDEIFATQIEYSENNSSLSKLSTPTEIIIHHRSNLSENLSILTDDEKKSLQIPREQSNIKKSIDVTLTEKLSLLTDDTNENFLRNVKYNSDNKTILERIGQIMGLNTLVR